LADVPALLLFLGRSPVNEARARGRLANRERELASFFPLLSGCLISRDKQRSLVYAPGGMIRGLVCLRTCHGPGAWEIEHLLLAPGHEDCCLGLLERPGSAGDGFGVGRLFLRVDSASAAVDMARQAGFGHYLTEAVYRLEEGRRAEARGSPVAARPRVSADGYRLFRLYSAAVPMQVRRVEGMTFEEWQQSRERGVARDSVLEDGGEIRAWLRMRVEGTAGQFDIVTDLAADELGQVVDCCLHALRGKDPVYCLVPEFQVQLRSIIEERGFRQAAEYACLSKQLLARVHEPRLVPLQA
jgi:hypothetical protein